MRGIQPLAPEQLGRFAKQATHAAGIPGRWLRSVRACTRAEHRCKNALKLGRNSGCEMFNNDLFRLLGLVWA